MARWAGPVFCPFPRRHDGRHSPTLRRVKNSQTHPMATSRTVNSRIRTTAAWRYGTPAIVLHWLLAALIAGMVTLGWYMMTIEKQPQGPWYFDLHRSIGLVVAAVVGDAVGGEQVTLAVGDV